MSQDYTVNTLQVRALFGALQPDNVVVTFRKDAIAQKPNETFNLMLIPLVQPTPREGLFFLNTTQVTIMDSDSKENYLYLAKSQFAGVQYLCMSFTVKWRTGKQIHVITS